MAGKHDFRQHFKYPLRTSAPIGRVATYLDKEQQASAEYCEDDEPEKKENYREEERILQSDGDSNMGYIIMQEKRYAR